jgi:PEP-CTERM/exosortase A-associated glycosyltransferase
MSLRILHILDHSLPHHSGYVFRTLSILKEQRRLGWETFQLTSPKQGECETDQESVDGWHFYRTRQERRGLAKGAMSSEIMLMKATARRIAELVRELRPHVLHAHSPVLNALPAIWVGRSQRIPVVYEMRASWEDAAVDHGTTSAGSARYRLSRSVETFALRRARQITTICEGLRRDIVARGIPADKVTVIPNAVDVDAFPFHQNGDPSLAAELGLAGFTVLGFAGSFYAYEGLDLLVSALPLLLPRRPEVKLLLVGGGFQLEALKAQARALKLEDRVVFAGRVPHADVHRYYGLIDVLVYPRRSNRLTELVTPLKPLEAMAQGRLLVASDVGGHRELIRDGETGILFRAGDPRALAAAVERVLGAPEDWERLRRAGRRFVESERTWARSVARYADVYGRLLPPSQIEAGTPMGQEPG